MLPRLLRQLTRPTAPDAELLHLFLACRDEAAFGEIVRRHGPVVHRVCRRLVDASLADDAFQATFLILATRANTVQRADSLGSWLVGVAGKVARQMRKANQRRHHHEHTAASQMTATANADRQPELAELSRILDEELTLLPDHLRAPVVACWLHGRTQGEAARELGSSVRTVRRRLEQAKQRLQVRLQRRGVVPIIATSLISGAGVGTASVPTELVTKTVSFVFDFLAGGLATTLPAALIAQGVMMTLLTRKIPALLVGLAVGVTAIGVGVGQDNKPVASETPLVAPRSAGPQELPLPPPQTDKPKQVPKQGDKLTLVPKQTDKKESAPDRKTIHVGDIHGVYTEHFYVRSPDELTSRAIAAEAEYLREHLAMTWIRKPLPTKRLLVIDVTWGNGGRTTTEFPTDDRDYIKIDEQRAATTDLLLHVQLPNQIGEKIFRAKIQLANSTLEPNLRQTLPNEMMRCVLHYNFGKPLPPWADKGITNFIGPLHSQESCDHYCREIVNTGKALRLKVMLPMMENPSDIRVTVLQGHSLVRFLLTRKPREIGSSDKLEGDALSRAGLMHFLNIGLTKSWTEATQVVYGYETIDDLEEAWIAWLRKPESLLARPIVSAHPLPMPKVESDTIPPTTVLGGVPNTPTLSAPQGFNAFAPPGPPALPSVKNPIRP